MNRMGTCERCGQTVAMDRLLITATGHVCLGCRASTELDASERDATISMIGSPIAAGVIAWGLLCVPLVNAFAPGLVGLLAIWRAIEAFRWFADLNRRRQAPVQEWQKAMLIVGGVLGILLGLPMVGFQLLFWLGMGSALILGGL